MKRMGKCHIELTMGKNKWWWMYSNTFNCCPLEPYWFLYAILMGNLLYSLKGTVGYSGCNWILGIGVAVLEPVMMLCSVCASLLWSWVATTAGQGKLMYFVFVSWLPIEAALSIILISVPCIFYYFLQWLTNVQLTDKLWHSSYMFRHYSVILREFIVPCQVMQICQMQ
jgi:hypothetical protein